MILRAVSCCTKLPVLGPTSNVGKNRLRPQPKTRPVLRSIGLKMDTFVDRFGSADNRQIRILMSVTERRLQQVN